MQFYEQVELKQASELCPPMFCQMRPIRRGQVPVAPSLVVGLLVFLLRCTSLGILPLVVSLRYSSLNIIPNVLSIDATA